MINKPAPNEYNPFYETYISKIPNDDVLQFLKDQAIEIPAILRGIREDKVTYRYAEGKWNIAELLNHINDTERVFSYRAFAIARGEKQSLPGMDQDEYAAGANTDSRSFESLIQEFETIRASTVSLLDSVDESMLSNEGLASGFPITLRGLVGIIAGHAHHHMGILKERYL